MDINDGALSFDAVINTADLEKMAKVVEDKIIGMASTVEKESSKMGDSFNDGMSKITDQIAKQKEVISSLEDQYNKIQKTLDTTSLEDGMEDEYLKARQALSEVNTELQEQRENLGFIEAAHKQASAEMAKSTKAISDANKVAKDSSSGWNDIITNSGDASKAIVFQKNHLSELHKESERTKQEMKELSAVIASIQDPTSKTKSARQEEYAQLASKSKELTMTIKDEEAGLKKLQKGYDDLKKSEENAIRKKETLSEKTQTYMSQLRKIREEMIGLEMEGKKESPRYRELQAELERTGTAYRKVQQEQKYLTTAGSATISGLLSGMSAVSGAFSAGSGVMSLFVTDNAKLVAIQTKLQAAMAITIGLQQVSTALHSTSAFRMNVVTKVTNAYAIANTKLAVGLGISTLAAKALMATLTLGLSVAITGVIYLISKFSSEQSKAREEILKFNESVASSANSLRSDFEKLRKEWELAGNDLQKKEKLVLKNGDAYNKLGVSINNVEDADRIFRDNAPEFVKSIMLRAKAAAAMDIASEKYKESIQKMLDAEERASNPTFWDKTKGFMSMVGLQQSGEYVSWDDMTKEWAESAKKDLEKESAKLDGEALNLIAKSLGWTDEDNKALEALGIKSSNEIKDHTKKYYQEIQKQKQKALDEMTKDELKSAAGQKVKQERDEAAKILQNWDKTPTKSANQLASLAQKKIEADQWLFNKRQELNNEQIKTELDNEQRSLDLQKDSYEKRKAQNELNYRKEIQSIKDFEANKAKAQQEAAKKIYTSENGGDDKGFEFSKFDMSKLPIGLRPEDIKEQVSKLSSAAQSAWENADMLAYEEMTKEFMSFQQQKADVTKTYQDLITQYESMGLGDRVALIKKERDQVLGEISAMEVQSSELWKDLFQNIDNLSESSVNSAIAKLRELVAKVEDIDIKTALNKQLDEAKSSIDSKNPFSKMTSSIKDYKNASDEASKNKAIKNIGESAKDMADIVTDSLGSVVNGLKDLGMMDEGTEAILGDVMGLVGGMGDLAAGYASMNPAQMIQGTVGIITSAFSLFDSKSRDIERKIKEHKKQLVELGRVYKDIEYQVNNAVGEDYYSKQFEAIENLKKQQKEVEGLLYQENRKKKKDKDEDAINSYKDQLADIPRQIQDIEREIADTLVQTSFKDMSNQLADALVSAFEAGEGAAEDFDKTFNKVIANAVKNSLKMRILEPEINRFTESLSKYMQGNNYSAVGFDFEHWRELLKNAGDTFTSGLEEFEKYFDVVSDDIINDPLTGAVKAVTEETASALAGQITMMRIKQADIAEFLKGQLYNAILKIADNSEYLETIDKTLKDIKDDKSSNGLRAKGL